MRINQCGRFNQFINVIMEIHCLTMGDYGLKWEIYHFKKIQELTVQFNDSITLVKKHL